MNTTARLYGSRSHLHPEKICSRAFQIVEAAFFKQRQEVKKLYNPYRNLCLDKCYGESKRTLWEWTDFSKEQDNDD